MKPTKLFLSILTLAFMVSSCSNEEAIQPEAKVSLLKSYKVSKTEGKYAVDYTVRNATSQLVKNKVTNSSDVFLYAAALNEGAIPFSESLAISNNELQLNFIDTKTNKKPSITIMDDNIVFAKDTGKTGMLSDYSITSNEDGSYDLDFTVRNRVEVTFVYNEEIDTYEVHLQRGEGTTANFSRNFTAKSTLLKIDFVNHLSAAPKGYASRELSLVERKPRIVIDTGTGTDL